MSCFSIVMLDFGGVIHEAQQTKQTRQTPQRRTPQNEKDPNSCDANQMGWWSLQIFPLMLSDRCSAVNESTVSYSIYSWNCDVRYQQDPCSLSNNAKGTLIFFPLFWLGGEWITFFWPCIASIKVIKIWLVAIGKRESHLHTNRQVLGFMYVCGLGW